MDIQKAPHLSLLHRTFGWKGSERLSVAVYAGFSLLDNSLLIEEAELWEKLGQSLEQWQAPDIIMPKARGEVLVLAKAFAPRGGEVQGLTVSLETGNAGNAGRVKKTLTVFGDRFWEEQLLGNARVEAIPFREMNVTWKNAFGGAGYEYNPVGKGTGPANGDSRIPLPNVEYPHALITSPKDRPVPAGFGPLGLDWPARLRGLGTYDQNWFTDHWPGLPDDFNFAYCNLAPEDQQFEGYWKGRERIRLEGMHPHHASIETALPGLKARVFVNRQESTKQTFSELETCLDTLLLVPHLDLGVCIWRAVLQTVDDEASDILNVMAYMESMDANPKSILDYQALLPRAMDQSDATENVPAPAVESTTTETRLSELETQLSREEGNATGEMADKTMDETMDETMGEDISLTPEAVETKHAQGESFAGVDLTGLDLSGRNLAGIDLRDAILEDTDFNHCNLKDANLAGAMADRAIFTKADLSNADLTGLIAPGARMDEANLQKATMTQSDLDSANLAKALLAKAKLDNALLDNTDLEQADCSEIHAPNARFCAANLRGATLTKATLANADLDGAQLANADLKQVNGVGLNLGNAQAQGADFLQANLENSRADTGADFSSSRFDGASLDNATWEGVRLEQAALPRARMRKAHMNGCVFTKAILTHVDASMANFSKSDFTKARVAGINLFQGSFRKATLTDADLRSANLYAVDFYKAIMGSVRLDNANIDRTLLSVTSWSP